MVAMSSGATSTVHGIAIRDQDGRLIDFLETSTPQSTSALLEETKRNNPNRKIREEYIPESDTAYQKLKAKTDV